MTNLDWIRPMFPEISSLRAIGKGGQKQVFVGQHAVDGNVALKLFHMNTDEERVVREIRAAQEVPSQRVPRIFATGRAASPMGDIIWVREEWIPGSDLREVLRNGPLAPRSVLILARDMLEALEAAERVRIVHRDVKPANILVAENDAYWLVDFGFARHLDMVSITATAQAYGYGTPGYAPPEQFRNVKPEIDARVDLFALGVTLYECVEGVNPFFVNARDMGEVLRRVENQPLPPISQQIDARGQFRDFVLALTRIQPDHRPATAADALKWIREICDSEHI